MTEQQNNTQVLLSEAEEILGLSRYRLRTLCADGYFTTAKKNFLQRWVIDRTEILADKNKRAVKRAAVKSGSKYYMKPSLRAVKMMRRILEASEDLSPEDKTAIDKFIQRIERLYNV